jgi:hypothetical protein
MLTPVKIWKGIKPVVSAAWPVQLPAYRQNQIGHYYSFTVLKLIGVLESGNLGSRIADFGLGKLELNLYLKKNPRSRITNPKLNHSITPVLHDRDARELMANL